MSLGAARWSRRAARAVLRNRFYGETMMKELMALILVGAIAVLGYAFFAGRSHTIYFRYNCNLEIPWYEALFLATEKCPGNCGQPRS